MSRPSQCNSRIYYPYLLCSLMKQHIFTVKTADLEAWAAGDHEERNKKQQGVLRLKYCLVFLHFSSFFICHDLRFGQ